MKKLVTVILSLLLIVSCVSAEEQIAVTVGNRSFTVAEVQQTLDLYLSLSESTGELTVAQKQVIVQETIEEYVQRGLVEIICEQLGLARFTDEQLNTLRETAQEECQTMRDEVRASYSAELVSEAELDAIMAQEGITEERLYNELLHEAKRQCLLNYYGITISVEDAELEKYFEEYYAAPYRERYEKNIPLYEDEVLYGDGISFYMPRGYRQLRMIVLNIPDAQREKIAALIAEAESYLAAAGQAYTDAADMVIAGKDPSDARKRYLDAKASYERIQADSLIAAAEVIPAMKPVTDEIYGRIEAGETFVSLISTYSVQSDAVYYWHPESEKWESELSEAAQTLENPGDISQPVFCNGQLYILCYEKDVPTGLATLNEENRTLVQASVKKMKRSEKITEITQEYRDSIAIDTHPELLTY